MDEGEGKQEPAGTHRHVRFIHLKPDQISTDEEGQVVIDSEGVSLSISLRKKGKGSGQPKKKGASAGKHVRILHLGPDEIELNEEGEVVIDSGDVNVVLGFREKDKEEESK